MIINNPELLRAVRAHFPTADSVVVDGQRVFVRCGEQPDWSGWGRRRGPSTVTLGTSPATAVLADKARTIAMGVEP